MSKKWYEYFVVTAPKDAGDGVTESPAPVRASDLVPDAGGDATFTTPLSSDAAGVKIAEIADDAVQRDRRLIPRPSAAAPEAVENDQADALISDYPFAAEEIKSHPRTTIVKYNLNQSKYRWRCPKATLIWSTRSIRPSRSSARRRSTPTWCGRRTDTVRAGDTLTKIAASQLGDINRWKEIWDFNRDRVANENLIYPRLVLLMPS